MSHASHHAHSTSDPSSDRAPIDAVVTWVDGSDPEHQRKRLRALHQDADDEKLLETSADPTRFQDSGELEYCLRSIRRFAPWIRTIHLVTDDQQPDFLQEDEDLRKQVRIVDHTEIFRSYEWALPTFNSRTIETALWRIPGLAPRFIYFNDDFMLVQETDPNDFFTEDGVVLRGTWTSMVGTSLLSAQVNRLMNLAAKHILGITRSMNHLLQTRSAQLAGFEDQYFHVPHVPHPVQRDTVARFFDTREDLFEENIQYPFRSTEQFSAIYLAHHLEIKRNRAILKSDDDALMINGEMSVPGLFRRKLRRIEQGNVTFLCVQALEKFSAASRADIQSTLDAVLR